MSGDRGNKAGRMVAWIPNGVTSLSVVGRPDVTRSVRAVTS